MLRVLGNEVQTIAKTFGGIAGRFGADRFDIYCRHTEDYRAIFDRLQNKMEAISPNASIQLRMGVMPWQADLEPIQMFDRARTACNIARGHYHERLIVFDNQVRERELLDQRLLNDLRRALDSYEFEVYYQPKYDVRTEPPKLVSAEALVRWNHPELGTIAPKDFIPLFERNGQIREVDMLCVIDFIDIQLITVYQFMKNICIHLISTPLLIFANASSASCWCSFSWNVRPRWGGR